MPDQDKSKVMKNITILLPDNIGGVFYNSLNLATLLGNKEFDTSFILTRQTDKPGISKAPRFTAFDTQFFSFSAADNKHYVFRCLARKISSSCDIIILNDWLDYKLVSHRKIPQKVVAIVHGDYDYYYDLAVASESRIDHFVCVSVAITERLGVLLPHRKDDIVFIPPVVPDKEVQRPVNTENGIRIVFVGRLIPEKGFDLLPEIDRELKERNIACAWTIIAPHTTSQYDEWLNQPNVHYREYVPNHEMTAEYAKQDIILLPSHAEGFPLSILEAMKCGVVPLVTNLNTVAGVLIKNGETGFLFEKNDKTAIVGQIANLNGDRVLLRQVGIDTRDYANLLYSETVFRTKWTGLLNRKDSGKNIDKPTTFIYDRLDIPWLPNVFTRAIRMSL
jgi:glycosyltransferase involved in cell wall biosynthesis